MFGFLIKKAFFDLWDNFLPAILVNLGFIAVLAVPVLLPPVVTAAGAAFGFVVLAAGVVAGIVYLGGVFGIAGEITDYQSLEWRSFFAPLRSWLPATLTLGGITVVHAALLAVAIPVYSAMNNLFGLFAIAVLFWMSVIWWLSAQFFLPVRGRLSTNPMKIIRKSFILSFDNTGFTIALAVGAVVILAVSFFTAFLIPGVAGLAIWYQAAVKLRLYKYDYLEEHPEASRKEIPWDALLYDDRERVGKRTLRGMIFPWKE